MPTTLAFILTPTTEIGIRGFKTHIQSRKQPCRTPQSAPCRPHPTLLRMQINHEPADNTDHSFQQLASDIREYLKTCPESQPSPLAYITLRNAGRMDLISRIMEAGGYIQVSTTLGVRVDDSQFISPPATSAFSAELSPDTSHDYTASLAIGRDLEARLNTIEDVIKEEGDRKSPERRVANASVADDVPTGEELRLQNETIRPAIVDKPIPFDERFTLTPAMRIGMLTLAVAVAIAFGRASDGVVSDDVITTCRSLAYGLLSAHVAFAVYAGAVLAPQKHRSRSLWFAKVFLGGPLGVRYLRGLDELPN